MALMCDLRALAPAAQIQPLLGSYASPATGSIVIPSHGMVPQAAPPTTYSLDLHQPAACCEHVARDGKSPAKRHTCKDSSRIAVSAVGIAKVVRSRELVFQNFRRNLSSWGLVWIPQSS